jgi:hypothetical protein
MVRYLSSESSFKASPEVLLRRPGMLLVIGLSGNERKLYGCAN